MHTKVWLFALAFLPLELFGATPTINLETSQVEAAVLGGAWHFQTGDEARWADPAFDDSAWPLLRPEEGFFEQGYQGYSGFAWYRMQVTAPAWHKPLALLMPTINDVYEVYLNGHLTGQLGRFPPHPKVMTAYTQLFTIPDHLVTPGEPLVVAIRVWRSERMSMYPGGGLSSAPLLGSLTTLEKLQGLEMKELYWSSSGNVFSFLANLLTALAGLALFLMRRKEREYLWFGAAQVFWTIQSAVYARSMSVPTDYVSTEILTSGSMAIAQLLNLEFFVTLLGLKKRAFYWTAAGAAILSALVLVPAKMDWLSEPRASVVQTVLELAYGICVPALIYVGARRGSLEAKLLLVPFTLSFLCNAVAPLFYIPALAQIPWVMAFGKHFGMLMTWPFPIGATLLAGLLALFSVVAVLVLRFARSRRDEERMEAELAAARAVQHVLIPDEIPTVPGFQIECVYKPAGEVGGDFFQILPLPDGDALVAIGDVSGKGLPAAMTVSLLVGMVRVLARSTRRPAEILTVLNQCVMGRTNGGFTTCLILLMSKNGNVIGANAGHLSPYVNGREISLCNGTPLGVDGTSTYLEGSFHLGPSDQVTLLTDGVPEARSANGELFGFERAAGMSAQPAAEIAAAAQRFGQEDDITVLSLTRQQLGKEARTLLEQPVLSPAEV